MALIKCPECGREVSDKATSCPTCGCPIHEISPSGKVKIKLGLHSNTPYLLPNVHQKAEIRMNSESGDLLWEGLVGDVAEIDFDGPTNIFIKYYLCSAYFGGSCIGTIDPSKSKRYNISVRDNLLKSTLYLNAVDVIDLD